MHLEVRDIKRENLPEYIFNEGNEEATNRVRPPLRGKSKGTLGGSGGSQNVRVKTLEPAKE